jgi:hypothetical protein
MVLTFTDLQLNPLLADAVGSFSIGHAPILSVVLLIVVAKYLPETKGKTVIGVKHTVFPRC